MPQIRCPGSIKSLAPTPIERKCLRCGRTVELWSDEEKVVCKCGAPIFKDRQPTCVEWCPAAEKCLGDVLDVKKIKAAAKERAAQEGNPEFVKEVVDLIRERQAKCLCEGRPKG
ncbi:MAG: hypothetical protein FJ279_29565 [Planctomycetes bacterium]|nr:hypothetical protein [Planctomycetota bacterium]